MRSRKAGSAMLATVSVLALAGIVTLATTRGDDGVPRPTPGPGFASVETTDRAGLLAYARSLSFDTVAGVADRRLIEQAPCGPECANRVLEIQPEVGAFRLSRGDLEKGRVLARIVSAAEDGSTPVESYWWVDGSQGKLRSLFISADPGSPLIERPLVIDEHSHFHWKQSVARWRWAKDGNEPWTTCVDQGCCKVGG